MNPKPVFTIPSYSKTFASITLHTTLHITLHIISRKITKKRYSFSFQKKLLHHVGKIAKGMRWWERQGSSIWGVRLWEGQWSDLWVMLIGEGQGFI